MTDRWKTCRSGAYLAGLAIENSMLGAAHACANPLTKNYGIVHGIALAVLLPHVVRWNACPDYRVPPGSRAASCGRLPPMPVCPLPSSELGVPKADLPRLSEEAAEQWTGRFNPRPINALEIYECAW